MAGQGSLDEAVLFVFRRALADQRLDVADHLLAAIELMAEGDTEAGPLAEAYYLLTKQLGR